MGLFGPSLVGDLMDADPSVSSNVNADGGAAGNTDVDLFADATFQAASPAEATPDSHNKVGSLIFFCIDCSYTN